MSDRPASIFPEVLHKGLTSFWLPIIYWANIFLTGFLFPVEKVFGISAHLWDFIVGASGALILLFFRYRLKLKNGAQISIATASRVLLAGTLGATLMPIFLARVISGYEPLKSEVQDQLKFAPVGTLGQMFTMALVIGAVRFSRSLNNQVADDRLALAAIQVHLREELESKKSSLMQEINQMLAPVLAKIQSGISTASSAIVPIIHDAIDGVVRPLSHTLDSQSETYRLENLKRQTIKRSISIKGLKDGFTRKADLRITVSPWLSITVYLLFPLLSLVYLYEFAAFLKIGIPFLLVSSTSMFVFQRFASARKVPTYQAYLISFFISIIQGALFELNPAVNSDLYNQESIRALSFSITFLTFFSAFFDLNLNRIRENTYAANAINQEIAHNISVVRQRLWYIHKRLSRQIHGGLQGELQAMALQLSNNKEVRPEGLTAFLDELNFGLLNEGFKEKSPEISEYLEELQEFWQGITSITYDVSAATTKHISSNTILLECMNEVIREAINNAIKHASATNISISISDRTGNLIALEVVNDVVKSESSASTDKGLGSKIYDEICQSWKLEQGKLESTLIATFAVDQSFA
jgi:signal transduction histidine kinase